MGKYTTKKTDDDGNDFWESTDGSIHKTRKAVWQHSKSLELPTESETKSESGQPFLQQQSPSCEAVSGCYYKNHY